MLRAFLFGCLLLGWVCWPATVFAHHFTIELKAKAGKETRSASAETAARGAKPKPRGVLHARVKAPITVTWKLTNIDPKTTYKDVIVHFFAVKVDKVGQATVPKLNRGVAAETALTMDFNPKDSTQGELTFRIDTPGVYLVRVETIGAALGLEGHEHFATLDVVVE